MALLAPDPTSPARRDLDAVAGVACSLITDEALKDDALVVHGVGPRLRVYCLYGDDAIEGDSVNEGALSFVLTDGDWRMSLPCPDEDLPWVQRSLAKASTRVTARALGEAAEGEARDAGAQGGAANGHAAGAADSSTVNLDAFLRR